MFVKRKFAIYSMPLLASQPVIRKHLTERRPKGSAPTIASKRQRAPFHRDGFRLHAIEFHARTSASFARNRSFAHAGPDIVPTALARNHGFSPEFGARSGNCYGLSNSIMIPANHGGRLMMTTVDL